MEPEPTGELFGFAHGIAGLLFALLAYVAFRYGPRTAALRAWAAVCVAAALYGLLVSITAQIETVALALILMRACMSSGLIALLLFLVFALTFVGWTRTSTLLAGGASASVLGLLAVLWGTDLLLAGVTEADYSRLSPAPGPLTLLYGASLVAFWAISLGVFVHALWKTTGLRRVQAGYMVAAFGIGAVATVASVVAPALGRHSLLAMSPALLLPLFPLTITYAIVRHRLWDIRTIVHRTAVWVVLSLALLVPIYLVVRLAAGALPAFGDGETAVLLVGLFLLAHLYLRLAQPRLDHLFQRRAYDRARVRARLTETLARLGRPDEVVRQLAETLGETLYPERLEVLSRTEGGPWRRVGRNGGESEEGPCDPVETGGRFVAWLAVAARAVDRSALEADRELAGLRDEAEAYFAAHDCELLVPLAQGGDLLGVVHLGARRSLRPYSREDLELLEGVAAEASMALANALLFERADAQRRDLADLTGNLEERVAERTRELEEAHERLARAFEDLQDLDRLKSRFFANISHELRTPLTLVLAPLDSMLSGELGSFDDVQLQHLATIRRSALRLLKMINDLLDLSRLEESRVRLRIARFELVPFASRVIDTASTLASRKNVEVALEARARPSVEADEERLEGVLVNLLSNALKFTDPGGRVRVVVDLEGDRAVLAVEDSGIGIPAEDLGHVFDRFYQVDQSPTRRHGGTGIGLALAKELVELHGGSIEVSSEPGRGSIFTVRLPLDASRIDQELVDRRQERRPVAERRRADDLGLPEWADQLVSAEEYRFLDVAAATERRLVPREQGGALGAARVLVVEDNADMLRYVHQVLSDHYEVWTVQDGGRAWDLLLREGHDLVVSDIMMPGLSGIELCERIKTDPRTARTPVVFLTARGAPEHRIEGHEVGADGYLPKPFSPGELRAVIDRLLSERSRSTADAARQRTASLQTLLAGMAHEMRNAGHQVQSAHSAICELVASAGGPDAGRAERVAALEAVSRKAVARVTAVVDSLRQYALGGDAGAWRRLSLDEQVRGAVALLSNGGEARVAVRLELGSGAEIRGPTEALRHLVINLVENAMQASRPGGEVRVTTRLEGERVVLSVSDDGSGMSREVMDRAFEPFFTTKGPSEGSGLGLALVRRTVNDLGGEVRLRSREGVGTEIEVRIPTAPGHGPRRWASHGEA